MTNRLPPQPDRREIRVARGPKEAVDPKKTLAQWDEFEMAFPGVVAPTRVLLLAGSECRFTCTMCDLWRHTLDHATTTGDIVIQIEQALHSPFNLPKTSPSNTTILQERWIKLYNSSNFFDPFNVPTEDLVPIAKLLPEFSRIIVENHPRLLHDTIPKFRDLLNGKLEIAMGLETADPATLKWLNKGMVLDDFKIATTQLQQWNIDARVFLLLGLPGKTFSESLHSCLEAIELASSLGVRHCSVIPMRTQHGVMAKLSNDHWVADITAQDLEEALSLMLGRYSAIVTVDLWDWDRLPGHCDICRQVRKDRLAAMCYQQRSLPLDITTCECPSKHETSLATKH